MLYYVLLKKIHKKVYVMCGRYSLTTPVDSMAGLFGFDERPNLAARYNIAPTQDVLICALRRIRHRAGRYRAVGVNAAMGEKSR